MYNKNLKSLIFCLIVLILPIVCVFLIKAIIQNISWKTFIYIIILNVFIVLFKNIKFLNNTYHYILHLFGLNYLLLIGIGILLHLLFYFSTCFLIPEILIISFNYFFKTEISIETHDYIFYTLGFSLIVLFSSHVLKIINLISPFYRKNSNKLKSFKIDVINEYIFQINNMRFLIFIFYCFYLIRNNIYYDQNGINKAMMQSFVTLIAFDRLYTIATLNKFSFNTLKFKIIKSYLRKKHSNNI